jgi:hypothetical protein
VCELLYGEVGIALESLDQKTQVLWFKSLFHGGFLNASTSCSVKCLWGHKLFLYLIFIIDLAHGLASTIPCFRCDS